jgi:hypothetical protein
MCESSIAPRLSAVDIGLADALQALRACRRPWSSFPARIPHWSIRSGDSARGRLMRLKTFIVNRKIATDMHELFERNHRHWRSDPLMNLSFVCGSDGSPRVKTTHWQIEFQFNPAYCSLATSASVSPAAERPMSAICGLTLLLLTGGAGSQTSSV